MTSAQVVKCWLRHGTTQTTDMVLSILQTHKQGLTTKEIYEQVHIKYPNAFEAAPPPPQPDLRIRSPRGRIVHPQPQPEHRNHPIRSIRYLKGVVLKELEQQRWIEKFHTHLPVPHTGPGNATMLAWGWRLREPESEETRRVQVASAQRKDQQGYQRGGKPLRM